jgi:hypothetical protein
VEADEACRAGHENPHVDNGLPRYRGRPGTYLVKLLTR